MSPAHGPPPSAESRDERAPLVALGKRVRALRESLKLTQEEFARRCDISVSFASLLERGERSPSYETMLTIARALEVPMAELFRDGASTLETADPTHVRLLDFARRTHLTRQQVDRLIAVGYAMFGLGREAGATGSPRCAVEGCDRPVLARGLCAPHYHRNRRARLHEDPSRSR